MKVDRLLLNSFGAFTEVSIVFTPGLNLFFGQNEAGKSTLIDGLLLTLLGAPANAERRLRYAPLGRPDYRAALFFTAADGRLFRVERDLAPGGKDAAGIKEGADWLLKKKAETLLKEFALPPLDLARSTLVVDGTEVVLAAKDAETVSKAISARATRDENSVPGQQAMKRLDERRRLLENKERKALEADLKAMSEAAQELAKAAAEGRRLGEARRLAEERLRDGQTLTARYKPALEAFEAFKKARQTHEEAVKRHETVFKDLRAIKEKAAEIESLTREMQGLLPAGEAGELPARFRRLQMRREETAKHRADLARLQENLRPLRERLGVCQREGFTPERLRELERIDQALVLARKDLAAKEAFLAKAGPGASRGFIGHLLACSVCLAGLALGLYRFWPGWILAGIGLACELALLWRGRTRAEGQGELAAAVNGARRELELVQATFIAQAGGRDLAAWQREYASVRALQEEIAALEAQVKIYEGLAELTAAEKEELAATLARTGARDEAELAGRIAAWEACAERLKEARAQRTFLLREEEPAQWEAKELALAREEYTAKEALAAREEAAAGLEPEAMARFREELAALDLPALEREAAAARSACGQHEKSTARWDAWEIDTGLALCEAALAENRRRAEAVKLAIDLLEQAVAEVQGSLVPRLETVAGRYFARLTGGRYDGLKIGAGAEMLTVEPCRAGAALPGRILSSGTADQLYLALRLALVEALQGPEPLPLILDDPFLTFDRPRLEAAFALVWELAQENQVILVTKDETLRDLAAQRGLKAAPLPGAG